jgi:hypothetical protein
VFTGIILLLHKMGHGVLLYGLEIIIFNLGDMRRPTLKMEEYMAFERGLMLSRFWKFSKFGYFDNI